MRTAIHGGWVVGYDADADSHYLLEEGTVIIDGATIAYVGTDDAEQVDRTIDASGKLVSPGFVNTHVHAGIEGATGLQDLPEGGGPAWIGAACDVLSQPLPRYLSDEQIRTHMEFGLVHLLKSGSTTIVDVIGSSSPWWLGNTPEDVEAFADAAGRLGARVYCTPGFRSLRACMMPDGSKSYVPMEKQGFEHLERAIEFIERRHGSFDGRLSGMLFPHAVDNTTPDLLRATREAADQLGVGIQIHAAQNVHEVAVTIERYNRTPIELLADTGVLGPGTILGHCIFVNTHSAINHPGDDLGLIAETRTSVAHSPLKFVYTGAVIESFQRYVDRGINMTIGTDVFPSDVSLEMRVASLAGKLVERNGSAVRTADLYTAATLGGARALARDDIGRLSPGARADVIVVDLDNVDVGPVHDPIRALVHYCTARDIETVFIDGEIVVENHRATGVDEEALMGDAWPIYEILRQKLAERNWNRPSVDEMFPTAFPIRQPNARAPAV
jgi:5-methylthioadenosine/S-adenosylhomocysteine deaminase